MSSCVSAHKLTIECVGFVFVFVFEFKVQEQSPPHLGKQDFV